MLALPRSFVERSIRGEEQHRSYVHTYRHNEEDLKSSTARHELGVRKLSYILETRTIRVPLILYVTQLKLRKKMETSTEVG
jgi:hypothetical protein